MVTRQLMKLSMRRRVAALFSFYLSCVAIDLFDFCLFYV